MTKLLTYIASIENSFMIQFVVKTILGKALKCRTNSIVEPMILTRLI